MNLYEIVNGYCGESYVRCLVVAETSEKAIKHSLNAEYDGYPKCYDNLEAILIFENLNEIHIGEFNDCSGY